MSQSRPVESESDVAPEGTESAGSLPAEVSAQTQMQSGGEYDQLRHRLLVTTVATSAAIACLLAWFYPANIVANYLLGAAVGLVYLRMLGRGVARLGSANRQLGGPQRLALFAGLIIVATQVDSLQVLPIFFGFLTYKIALFVYAFQTLVPLRKSKAP